MECPDLFDLDGQWFLSLLAAGVPHEKKRFRTPIPADFSRFRAISGSTARSARSSSLTAAFDFYAPQSFLDGARRIQFGWMGMPDAPLRQSRDRRVRLAALPDRAVRADESAAADCTAIL